MKFAGQLSLFLVIASLLSFRAAAAADLKVKIRTTVNGDTEYETIYIKGERRRTDYLNDRRMARILYCDARKAFMVDLDLGEYSEISWPWLPSPEELQKIMREQEGGAPAKPQGTSARSYGQMVDTGERREFFGRVARRMITERKHPAWKGPPSQPHREVVEDATEAWYIHLPITQNCEPAYLLEAAIGDSGVGVGAQLHLSDFPVKFTSTTRYKLFGADGSVREVTARFEREVIELSEDTLDPALFDVPVGFRKVRRIGFPQ